MQNIGDSVIDLSGVEFQDGVDFQFVGSDVTSLDPGEFVLVVRDRAAFESRYGLGLPVSGVYDGKLKNEGEQIELVDIAQGTLQKFDYNNGWYGSTDGRGFSLTRRDPSDAAPDLGEASAWRPSSALHGTPGRDDSFTVDAYTA